MGLIDRIDKAVIDEVQRAPELLRTIKYAIDKDRQPGRMEILTLLPLSAAETNRRESHFLVQAEAQSWQVQLTEEKLDCISSAITGGYPEMLNRIDQTRRFAWAKAYIKAIVERDVRDISSVEKLFEMPQLLEVLAEQSGKLTNFSKIATQLNLTTKTTQHYII